MSLRFVSVCYDTWISFFLFVVRVSNVRYSLIISTLNDASSNEIKKWIVVILLSYVQV